VNIRRILRIGRLKPAASAAPLDLTQLDVPEECRDWRQADVVKQDSLPVIDTEGVVRQVRCEDGVAILSQSCDASKQDRQTVQLARVVTLAGNIAEEARRGRRPRYAPLPDYFADLDVVATAAKAALVPKQRTPGAVADQHVHRFAGTAARKIGRFAFPDAVVEAFRPLQDDLFEKAKKSGSPMNKAIQDVRAFRVKVTEDWSSAPFELTVHAILEPGTIPVFEDDDFPDQPKGMRNDLLGGKPIAERVAEIVKYLIRPDLNDAARYWAWQMLAEAWGARCEVAADKAGVSAAIAGVTVELYIYDEYTLDLVDSTERLDLDYLSDSTAGAAE